MKFIYSQILILNMPTKNNNKQNKIIYPYSFMTIFNYPTNDILEIHYCCYG